jgi:hypothetical protein
MPVAMDADGTGRCAAHEGNQDSCTGLPERSSFQPHMPPKIPVVPCLHGM